MGCKRRNLRLDVCQEMRREKGPKRRQDGMSGFGGLGILDSRGKKKKKERRQEQNGSRRRNGSREERPAKRRHHNDITTTSARYIRTVCDSQSLYSPHMIKHIDWSGSRNSMQGMGSFLIQLFHPLIRNHPPGVGPHPTACVASP